MTTEEITNWPDIEVFTTNIKKSTQVKRQQELLELSFPDLIIDFDLEGNQKAYPCGHTILRVEGKKIDPDTIIATIKRSGYECDILADKICNNKDSGYE